MWNPTEETMKAMLKRLHELKETRRQAEELGFQVWVGDGFGRHRGILGMIDQDIWWQEEAIRKAIRLNPALATLTDKTSQEKEAPSDFSDWLSLELSEEQIKEL